MKRIAILAGLLVAVLAAAQDRRPEVMIVLERTACFGACPVYTVTIAADGRVEYEGREFVHVKGRASATIPEADVAALVAAFKTAGFFDLQDKYTANITDLPTTITTIRLDDQYKQVIDYYGAPKALKDLERQIDRVARTAQWVTGE